MNRNILIILLVVVVVVVAVAGYFATVVHGPSTSTMTSPTTTTTSKSSSPPSNVLFISIADAYKLEANSLGQAFQQATGTQYHVASGGSFAVARQIELGTLPTTVFMSVADSAYHPEYLGNYSPGWAIGLATDQLVIAYSNNSLSNPIAAKIVKLFQEAEQTNSSALFAYAFGNLTSGQVKVGISNPLTDPAGFRAWLSLEIAGYLYANNESYYMDRMLANRGNVTASNAAELVPALTSGNIQFLFIYKSVAIAQHLNYIQLPPQLNFGDPQYASFYRNFTFVAGGHTFKGGLIVLWISVPLNANNETLGLQFVNFTLNHLQILASYGLSPLQKPILEIWVPQSQLPPLIQQFIQSGRFQVVNVTA